MSTAARVLAGLAIAGGGVIIFALSVANGRIGSAHMSGGAVFGVFFGIAMIATGLATVAGYDGR